MSYAIALTQTQNYSIKSLKASSKSTQNSTPPPPVPSLYLYSMPSPSPPSSDSPKSDSPPVSPITGLISGSPARSLSGWPEFNFDLYGFFTTESPSLLNETWFLEDRETAGTSGAPGGGGLDGQGTGLNLGSTDEKAEKVTVLKGPNSEISDNSSITVQDRSRTDSASSGSKEKAALFDSWERRGSDGAKHLWDLESQKMLVKRALDSLIHAEDETRNDTPGGENSSAKRIRTECRGNEECGKAKPLPIDSNLDLENERQNTCYTFKNDYMNFADRLRLDSGGADESIMREVGGNTGKGFVTAHMNEEPNQDDNGDDGQRRFSREEKGKGVLYSADLFPNFFNGIDFVLESESEWINLNNNDNLDVPHLYDNVALQERLKEEWRKTRGYIMRRNRKETRKKMCRDAAKNNAHRFAHFTPGQEDGHASPKANVEVEIEIKEWSGPFSTALKTIRSRGMKGLPASIDWVPRSNKEQKRARGSAPSLQELCLDLLAKYADAIVSLENIPDGLKHRLCQLVCDSRKMNSHILELFLTGSPTEIRLRDCSWMTEEQFTEAFQSCDTTKLEVLQLDQCGRCTPDYVVFTTLAQSPNHLPRLTSLSLVGACRLSDRGLQSLVSCTPALRSINLSQCSLLTCLSLFYLVDVLGSLLKELYLDGCPGMNAAVVGPLLQKLENLEVLSVAGIQTVSDDFITNLVIKRGHNLKELVLKDCEKLTDTSVKFIAEFCPGLCSLDLMNLRKLTDSSIGYLTNGCLALQTLRLCHNRFSDEAIAAFLETTGMHLEELSLNNVRKVGHHTALSLATRAKHLHSLDLSWCRNLTDQHLGFIVDNCLSLRLLKLFGCSQITDDFLLGHSNREVKIIGCNMFPLLKHVNLVDPQRQGALRYSPAT